MADNYLEKQREQYEARKAAWEKSKKYGKKKSRPVQPHPTEACSNNGRPEQKNEP